ncbi:MAG TPA: DUF5000 domain-containing lipoprotein [Chitinophagaceae bacterium]|nr:DUF5000 domain-containing lipoprotein [Chitinophagaceae bacterium]
MKRTTIMLSAACCLLFLSDCKDYDHKPWGPTGRTPGQVTQIQVENLPGAAKLTYELPSDQDLLYVTAIFTLPSGESRSVKASAYRNYMLIQGFPLAKDYEVTLYTVNKSEKRSQPVSTTIHPSTPPLQDVFASLRVEPDFGGINITATNVSARGYVYSTLVKDSHGHWQLFDRNYSTLDSLNYSVHGLDSMETEFGIFVTDQWNNTSDTLVKTLKPLYEEMLDKTQWKLAPLASDFSTPFYPYSNVEHLWDNNIHEQSSIYCYYYAHPVSAPPLPSWFTIDLGRPYKLSRLRVYQYEGSGQYMYTDGNPRVYEIWGNTLAVDSWDSWKLLRHCVSIKPSGLPAGVRNGDDAAYAIKGEDFSFPLDAPAVRYIRFKLIDTWSHQPNLLLDEITLWGQKN